VYLKFAAGAPAAQSRRTAGAQALQQDFRYSKVLISL